MKNIIYTIIHILTLLNQTRPFQFMSPQVYCNDCTINAVTPYNVQLTRKYTSSLSDTPWNTQAVPSGSNITIHFPLEFTLSGSETCNSLTISGNSISTFNCFVNITSKSITIMGAITTNLFIDTVNLNILNVQNPSPAITTSPFTAQIGIDTSSNDLLGVVALQPGSFQSITVTFDPTTVNTTGNMIITGVLGNGVPSNGSITVVFPINLRWSQQITLTNTLPLSSSMQCSSLNSNIRYTLSCSGDAISKTVTITNAFSSSLAAGSVISFTINGLFSPPTTQSLDTIIVTTLNNGYGVDQSSPKVTGLTAKPISLTIGSTSSLVINTPLGLQFNFTLVDTISKNDYIVIGFPQNTNFTYQTYSCPQLNFSSNFSYVSSTGLLSMYQSSTSLNRNSGLSISITIRTFTCPSSARTFGPIFLYIMNNNGYKMSGSNSIAILPKAYVASMVTANTTINSVTSYTVSFQMTDPISSAGYFIVRLPTQIINSGSIDSQITGTSIKSIPIIQFINSSTFKLSSLNLSSSNIPPQNISIKINGLIQPSSVKNISSFILQIYFSASNDLVSQATTTSLITTTPGSIISATVTPGSNVTAATNVYTFQIRIGNLLNSGSQIIFTLPTTISLITGGSCTIQSITATCTVTSSSITFNLTSSFTAGSTITLSYSRFVNPASTKPTSSFAIKTLNSASQTVDILPSSIQLTVTMVNPSPLISVSLTRSSLQNRFSTSYTFFFTQRQIINQSTGIASIVFPSSVVIPSNVTCSSGSITQLCTISLNTINIQFTPTQQNDTIYNFTINAIQNPISFKPTTSISISTRTQDLLYQYSTISTGLEITNTLPSAFAALTFQFTNQVLSEQTSLVLNIAMSDSPSYLYIQYAPSFMVTNATQITCTSVQFIPICTLVLNSVTGLYQTKVISTSSIPTTLFTLNLSTLNNPSTIPTDYTWISSYTSDDFLISQNKNTVQFSTVCTFPCRLCNISTRTLCTGCYSNNVTNKIYLYQQQCLSTCPDGYVENNNTFACQACILPCLTCRTTKDYCITCNSSSAFKYLNRTSTTSTCLAECITFMYADTTQIPILCVDCVAPCSTCTTRASCSSCVSGYYLYVAQCVTSCPINITILINTTCYHCSSSCATCENSIGNCTSCSQTLSLYNNTCLTSCPGNLITINNVCTSCSSNCLTCSVTSTNCTSCFTNSSSPFFYNNSCINLCPNFYYPNTFQACLSCQLLNRGCKNCSSPTVCLSCDPGFVLLTGNCLSTVPDGYLNISGIAIPCEGQCQTCAVTLSNCTSCRTFNLFENHCISICPTGTVALNRTCRTCTYPCTQCINSTIICTKCASNSSLYLYNHSCIAPSSCPATTYPENATSECTNCTQPCNLCNSSVICINCINGYFYVNSSYTCQTTCPPFSVGVSRICMACVSPCETCKETTVKCLTCITNYFYNAPAFECLTTCPTGKIANQSIMQCVSCSSPCKTCINTTDTCLSCVLGTYLSNNLCVKVCPDGQYGVNGLCKNCQNNCTTCSSAIHCLSCSVPLVLYSAQCLQSCPGSHSIVSNDSVCLSCTTVVTGCSNCSEYGQCYSCFSPLIYFNRVCVNSCPDGYKYQSLTCVLKNQTDITLDESLQSFTFPIPFTILGCVLFVACCMSKLQNGNTYLIGLLYSLFGLVETGSFAYLIYEYYILGQNIYEKNSLYILFSVAGIIYLINLLSFIVQTIYLLNFDARFKNWFNSENKCPFTFVTILSLLINYKFKMILFSKLFKFYGMSAFLEKLSRFRLFNIFSFFGILPEALALYVCFVSIVKYTFQKLIFHAFLDVIIIFMINILLAILIVWKPDNFFHEDTEDGFAVNKIIKANGDDFSKQAILGHEQHVENQQYGPDSYLMLSKTPLADVSQISNELSESLSGNKVKVYFSNNQQLGSLGQSSNPFRREKKKDTIQNIMNDNIFGNISEQNDQYSQKPASNKELDDSYAGGSQNINEKQSPKSPRKHATIVIGNPVQHMKTNNATDQQDVGKRISKREKQLDLLRKQLQQKQQIRKQKRKSRKKLKKSIDIDLDTKQPQYEEITIKDETQKMHTQQDSNMKTMQQPKNVNLHAENKQTNVQEDFHDTAPPKDTLGSWRQLRITEENRKLPVFNQNSQEAQMNTISLPQSQHQQYQQEAQQNQITKKLYTQQLPAESNIIDIEKDLKQLQSQKIKERQQNKNKQIEKVKKDHQYEYQEQRSKDFQNSEIQNSSIDLLKKKIEHNNSKSLNGMQKDANNTRHSLQIKEFSYQQRFSKEIKDHSHDQGQNHNQILKQQSKYLFLQQSSKDYDQRAGTRLNFKNNQKKNQEYDEQLEDSQHQDQKINQRPFTASRKNKIKNSEALLEILARSQRQKMNSRGAGLHRIAYQEKSTGQRKNFRLSGIPQKTQSRQGGSLDGDQQKNSKLYKAGLNQFQRQRQSQDQLNRKKTMNHPLKTLKKKTDQDQNDLSSSFYQIQNSRNKSFNVGQLRKFASKDVSSENVDDLGLDYVDYKKNYEDLMNQRYQILPGSQRNSTRIGNFRGNSLPKPFLNNSPFKRSNFHKDSSQQIGLQGSGSDLQKYYKRQQRSLQKKQREKKDKNKSLTKQKSLEQTKRVKELERIYLSRK